MLQTMFDQPYELAGQLRGMAHPVALEQHDVQRRLAPTSFHYGYRTPLDRSFMSQMRAREVNQKRTPRAVGRSAKQAAEPERARCGMKFLGRGRRQLLRRRGARAAGIAWMEVSPR
jgi:hypothetical protein